MPLIYRDHNATTPVEPAVLDAMLPYFSADFGHAASITTLIGARPQEIVFTSGGTESDNHAIFGIVRNHPGATKHVITTPIEHEAVLNACQFLEKDSGGSTEVTYLPVDADGLVDPEAVRDAIRPQTALITIMHANNELGTVQPLAQIGKIAAQNDIFFHTDAVQSAGKSPLHVNALGVDLLAISGHKFYAALINGRPDQELSREEMIEHLLKQDRFRAPLHSTTNYNYNLHHSNMIADSPARA